MKELFLYSFLTACFSCFLDYCMLPEEIFGKNGKHAPRVFFDKIYSMSNECRQEVEEESYKAACDHIKAFKAEGSASIVRKYLKS